PPRMMCRTADADALVGHNIESRSARAPEAVARIAAEIHPVMAIGDVERLRQLARSRAKFSFIVDATSSFHQRDASGRLEGANQNESISFSFHQRVQHPVRAVIKIDVSRARLVAGHEVSRTR